MYGGFSIERCNDCKRQSKHILEQNAKAMQREQEASAI
jgi:hypothetical protein